MILHEVLQVIDNKYEVICNEKVLLDVFGSKRERLAVK